jgi:hypothetical protein
MHKTHHDYFPENAYTERSHLGKGSCARTPRGITTHRPSLKVWNFDSGSTWSKKAAVRMMNHDFYNKIVCGQVG